MASPRFTFVCGEDDFWVARRAREIYQRLSKEALDPAFGCEIVVGSAGNVAEVEKAVNEFTIAVQSIPLFGDRKVVWFKDITFLADSVTGRSQGTLAQVTNMRGLLESLDPAAVAVILSASPVDRRRSFPRWCSKNADYHLADSGKPAEKEAHLRDLINRESKRFGINIPYSAVNILMGKLNGNARLAVEEVRKLATYLGDRPEEVTEELLSELVPNFGEGDFFEPVEAFFSLKLEWTLNALRRYFFNAKDARPLLTMLQNRNRLMIQLKVLLMSGQIQRGPRGIDKASMEQAAALHAEAYSGEEGKSSFNVFSQNPWYLSRLAEPLGRLTLKELVDFQKEFLRGFREILSRPNEQMEVMREMAVRCLSR